MVRSGYIHTGTGEYYYKNGHIYRKKKGTYVRLSERKRYNKVEVTVSINGIRKQLSFINPKAAGKKLHLFDLLTDYEYCLWKKKLDFLGRSGWSRFNDMALKKYLQASFIINKDPARRKKFFEKLFKISEKNEKK